MTIATIVGRTREQKPGVAERLVVRKDEKLVAFKHQAKVDSQQIPVEGAVAGLSRR